MSRSRPTTAQPRILATLVALIAAASLALPSAASAGPLVASAETCQAAPMGQPFLPWLDAMSYVPQPQGDFEGKTDGWQLGSASISDGNEPYHVGAAGDSKSLSLPAGRSVTSSTMCVGLNEPTLRFFAKSSSSLLSSLTVKVLFEDATGSTRALPIGVVLPGPWAPTVPMPILANLLPLLPGDQTPVRFKFEASGSATWCIDDVYVDPRKS